MKNYMPCMSISVYRGPKIAFFLLLLLFPHLFIQFTFVFFIRHMFGMKYSDVRFFLISSWFWMRILYATVL